MSSPNIITGWAASQFAISGDLRDFIFWGPLRGVGCKRETSNGFVSSPVGLLGERASHGPVRTIYLRTGKARGVVPIGMGTGLGV